MRLTLTSPDFRHNGEIPPECTADGADLSPALEWQGAPPNTKSFVLIVEDPDAPNPKAPKRVWVHWVVYNIPPDVTSIPKGGPAPTGSIEGTNDGRRVQWQGPAPPVGRLRYFFKLYALDVMLGNLGPATRLQVEGAMRGHILAMTELVATYQRQKS
jgi:Raf kinase inhibitor-like YbhB/YbcL family protein